jgi:FlaA1/EpsC-like NDP-sugar epimerase
MAERVCRLMNPAGAPPAFVVTGARPGERLAEELASPGETLLRCGTDPVWRVAAPQLAEHTAVIRDIIDELRSLLPVATAAELRTRAMAFAGRLQ